MIGRRVYRLEWHETAMEQDSTFWDEVLEYFRNDDGEIFIDYDGFVDKLMEELETNPEFFWKHRDSIDGLMHEFEQQANRHEHDTALSLIIA